MEKGKPGDLPASRKALDPRQRREMLNELENLSGLLDEEDEPAAPMFDDLPVLKSFVDISTLQPKSASPQPAIVHGKPPVPERSALDAAEALHKRIAPGAANNATVSPDPASKAYQQVRQQASRVVDEIVASYMPRLEAELRLRLETEVDRLLKQTR